MKTWKRIAITSSAIVIVGAAALVARTLAMAGMFDEVKPLALKCNALTGVTGAEDIAIDRKDGLVFLSASDRRAPVAGKPKFADGIYTMSLAHPDAGFTRLVGRPQAATQTRAADQRREHPRHGAAKHGNQLAGAPLSSAWKPPTGRRRTPR